MPTVKMLLLVAVSINLIACSVMHPHVIPQSGPTMEQMYEWTGKSNSVRDTDTQRILPTHMLLPQPTKKVGNEVANDAPVLSSNLPASTVQPHFHQLPNPALQLYIYPHLAGQEQAPVPGYYTVVNAYPHDYYALPQE